MHEGASKKTSKYYIYMLAIYMVLNISLYFNLHLFQELRAMI